MANILQTFVGNKPQIFLLSTDDDLSDSLQSLWALDDIHWEIFSSGKALLERFFNDPPHMLICAETSEDISGLEIINIVKSENVYKQVCTIFVLGLESVEASITPGGGVIVDDFIVLPVDPLEMRTRLELALHRSSCTLDANPLTRLPGNTSIMQAIEKQISEKSSFAAAYLDIDNFKAFNDKYGFLRGDEALLMTARLLVATIMDFDAPYKFLGHIGGDDFFFIMPENSIEDVCKRLVATYDEIVPNFYDDEDREQQGITSKDRMGNLHKFPFMSISIAVTANTDARFAHYGEVSQALGQLKSLCKAKEGSCYVFDRRID